MVRLCGDTTSCAAQISANSGLSFCSVATIEAAYDLGPSAVATWRSIETSSRLCLFSSGSW